MTRTDGAGRAMQPRLSQALFRYKGIILSFPVEPLEVAAGLIAVVRGTRLAMVPMMNVEVALYLDRLIPIHLWGCVLVALGLLQLVAVGFEMCWLRKLMPFAILGVASAVGGGYVLTADAVNGLSVYLPTILLQLWIGVRVSNAADLTRPTPVRTNGA